MGPDEKGRAKQILSEYCQIPFDQNEEASHGYLRNNRLIKESVSTPEIGQYCLICSIIEEALVQ